MSTSARWRIFLMMLFLAAVLIIGVVATEMRRQAAAIAAEKERMEMRQRQTHFHKINAYLKDSLLAGWESTKSLFAEPEEPEPESTGVELMWATACDSMELGWRYLSEAVSGKPEVKEEPSTMDALRSWTSAKIWREEPPVVEKTSWEVAADSLAEVWQSEQAVALKTAFADMRELEYCGVSVLQCLSAVIGLSLLLARYVFFLRLMKALGSFAMNRLRLKVPLSFLLGIGRAIAKVSCDIIRLVRHRLQPSETGTLTEAQSVTQLEFDRLKESNKAEIAEFEKKLDEIQNHLRNRFDKIEDVLEITPQLFEDLEKLKDQVDEEQQKHGDELDQLLRHMRRMETCVTGVQEVVEGDRDWIKEKETFFGDLAAELKRRAAGMTPVPLDQDQEPFDPYPDIPLPDSFVTHTVSRTPSVRAPTPPPAPVSAIPKPTPLAKPVPRPFQTKIPRLTLRPIARRPTVTTAPVLKCPRPAATAAVTVTNPAQSPATPRKRQLKAPKSYVQEIRMKKRLKA